MLAHLTNSEQAATEPAPVAHDGNTGQPLIFHEKRWASSIFLQIPADILTALEGATESLPIKSATIDRRCVRTEPALTPFIDSEDWPERPIRVTVEGPCSIEISASDVLCWTEDLNRLADQGIVPRRPLKPVIQDTDHDGNLTELKALPGDFKALYEAMGSGELPHMDLLITAWRKFWRGRRPSDDKGRYPSNREVADWVVGKMEKESRTVAEHIAKIIRPVWAPVGRQPSDNK